MKDLEKQFQKETKLSFNNIPINGVHIEYINWLEKRIEDLSTGVVMPPRLTAENGAKALLMGEFFEKIEVQNEEYCGCGKCDYCIYIQDEDTMETIIQKVPVSWTTIKEIYAKVVAHYGT